MTFTVIDKRLVERNDLIFQEKYAKDSFRHMPDAADAYDTIEIEHAPICLFQKKQEGAQPDQPLDDLAAELAKG